MNRPAYSKYKASGVDWLGEVPEHWEVRRLKDIGVLTAGAGFPHEFQGKEDEELPFYKVGDLANSPDGRIMGDGEHTISKDLARALRAKVIPPASIVYAKIGAALLLNRRRITAAPCCIDNNMTAFIPNILQVTPAWGYHWMCNIDFGEFTNPGAIPSLSEGYQSILPIAVPTIAEQRAIADFLDGETARLDTLVAKKRELIARLKEKRAALITRAVTRGLDAAAPLKDSGVEWLGQVPEHWEVRRIKYVAKLESGHTPSKQVAEYWEDCDIPWVSLNDSKQLATCDYISETAVQINQLGMDNSSAHLLPEGVVVFTRDATIGLAAITTRPMAVSQHLIAWVPSNNILALYLLRVFHTMKPYLDSITAGATLKTIGMTDVKKLVTPVPPVEEQRAIADYLDRETAKLDRLTATIEAAIAKLTEYRAALITAAVTGKIDVRGLAAKEAA